MRKTVGGVYDVELDTGERVEAALRGRLKREQRTGDRVVAGDRVDVRQHEDGSVTIESVHDRTSVLARRAPGHGGRRAKVIVANVDQMAVVFAAARPDPNLRMLDRFLVLAEANELAAAIVVNKIDLADDQEIRERFGPYEAADYPVLRTSVLERRGLEAVRERLCGRTSVLTGPSGAGKSSLLNALEPELGRRVGVVRESGGQGRHTTVAVELLPLGCGGYVADTPGLREVGLWGVPIDDLDRCFPEFRPYIAGCRFGHSCSHVHEPDCAVREAVEAGEITRARYESYRTIRADEEAHT